MARTSVTPFSTARARPRHGALADLTVKNPPILVFDEAISAHDSKTEKAMQAELLAYDGAYAYLWQLQLQEEEERPKITVGNGLTPA